MRLTIKDVQRAITNAGNVSTFSELYRAALGNTPLDIAPRLDLELPLPDPVIFVQSRDAALAGIILGRGPSNSITATPDQIDVTVVTAPGFGNNVADFLKDVLDHVKPDMLALNVDPLSLSADLRYTFSLPCALGFSFISEIRKADQREIYAKRSFNPAVLSTDSIMNAWSRGLPVLPLGKPPTAAQLTYTPSQGYIDLNYPETVRWEADILGAEEELDKLLVNAGEEYKTAAETVSQGLIRNAASSQREKLLDESCYFVSRLIDVLVYEHRLERNPRILVVSDLAHYRDISYLCGLLQDGITDEIYVDAKSLPDFPTMIMDGVNQVYLENGNLNCQGVSQLFQGRFNDFVNQRTSEILSEEQGLKLAVAIAEKTRHHEEISRGISVRGSIAMIEVLRGLVSIRGVLTRDTIARAAMLTFVPRLTMRSGTLSENVLEDIVKEVLFDFSFESDFSESAIQSIRKLSGGDILEKLNQMGQLPQEGTNLKQSSSVPAVIPENESNRDVLKKLEKMDFLKKGQNGQYSLTQKALQAMLDQLEKRFQAKEITQEEFGRQKAILQSRMNNLDKPHFKMSAKELASTIMELIDAQDRQWNKDISFQTMRTYYHIKENSEGETLADEKRDYYSLQKLIDDLESRKILAVTQQSSGLLLTGLAMEMLLNYSLYQKQSNRHAQSVHGNGKTLSTERGQEIRRFSSGDAFRDVAVRPTLREIARQKRNLNEIRHSDLKVFLKQPRKPQSDIVICMDTSGSMGFHQKLMYARLVAAGLVEAAIRDKNRVGIVAFNDSGQINIPLTATDKETLLNCIAGLNARGNTNIGEGIKTSRNMLFREKGSSQKHIILVSDGQPTALSENAFSKLKGLEEKDLTEESAILETRMAAQNGIILSVIHIAGEGEANDKFVTNIAKAGKGKIQRISGPDDLKGLMS
jgi:Mg-chelatase subunit ChlD